MNSRHLLGLSAALMLIASLLFAYKLTVLGLPLTPGAETEVWTVEAKVSFLPGPGTVKVSLHIPSLIPGYALLPGSEHFVSKGYGFTTRFAEGGRVAQWAVRRATGPQTLYYRASLYADPGSAYADITPQFPPRPTLEEPFQTAMQVLVEEIKSVSADDETFTAQLLQRLNDPTPDQNVELFLSRIGDLTDRAQTATIILAQARIPSRLVRGVRMQDQRQAGILPWLEIHNGDDWVYFNPATGEQGIPLNYLSWWRGEAPLVHVEGGTGTQVGLAVRHNVEDALVVAEARADQRRSRLMDFSLFSLPLATQAVYAVLLVIPVGALIMVLMRNLIGIKTFGTFMPVLIALAFRETQLLAGVALFSTIVALGLALRFISNGCVCCWCRGWRRCW